MKTTVSSPTLFEKIIYELTVFLNVRTDGQEPGDAGPASTYDIIRPQVPQDQAPRVTGKKVKVSCNILFFLTLIRILFEEKRFEGITYSEVSHCIAENFCTRSGKNFDPDELLVFIETPYYKTDEEFIKVVKELIREFNQKKVKKN